MRWTAPPDRRELALVILSLLTYFFAYNLENLGIDPVATQSAVFRHIGFGKTRDIDADGRKPVGWRDRLEADIFGDWAWDEGHVVGHLREKSQPEVAGRHGASWLWRQKALKVHDAPFSDSNMDQALQRWGEDIPQTRMVKHVPGFTILDNVYVFNGTLYLISDTTQALPALDTMVLTSGNGFGPWKVISADEGRKLVGTYGSSIRGVSWMTADSSPHNSTLFALWRTYSSLDPLINGGGTKLAPPHRLIFPHNRFFSDENPDFGEYQIRRRRYDTGFHPYTAKAAFPQLTVQYFEDLEDYQKMSVPFVFERLVVSDKQAAGRYVGHDVTPFASAVELEASPMWWEPVRRTLTQFLGDPEVSAKAKFAITYIHSQSEDHGLKLSDDDHKALTSGLKSLSRNYGYEVYIVSSKTEDTDWTERMTAIAKSSVVIGAHGVHMMDSVFMKPSPESSVMEFFPSDTYARDQEIVAHSLGLKYRAWWGSRSSTSDFPDAFAPKQEPVIMDVEAVVRAIHESLSS